MIEKKNFYINGKWVAPVKPNDFDVIDPSTEEAFAVISLGSIEDTDKAISAAKVAFETWRETTKEERVKLLEKFDKIYNRRWNERLSTYDVIRTYGKEFKCIFVGDATMSPYEIVIPGGGNEHFNDEPGRVWLERAITQWPSYIWINPVIEKHWEYSESTMIIKDIFQNRMVPLTLDGIDKATKILAKTNYN